MEEIEKNITLKNILLILWLVMMKLCS